VRQWPDPPGLAAHEAEEARAGQAHDEAVMRFREGDLWEQFDEHLHGGELLDELHKHLHAEHGLDYWLAYWAFVAQHFPDAYHRARDAAIEREAERLMEERRYAHAALR